MSTYTITKNINGEEMSVRRRGSSPVIGELESRLFEEIGYDTFPVESIDSYDIDTSDKHLSWMPFTSFWRIRGNNIYDMILDKRISLSEDGTTVSGVDNSDIKNYIAKNWNSYISIINHGGYSKENGFNIRKVREALMELDNNSSRSLQTETNQEVEPASSSNALTAIVNDINGSDISFNLQKIILDTIQKYINSEGDFAESVDVDAILNTLTDVIDGSNDIGQSTKDLAKSAIDYIKARETDVKIQEDDLALQKQFSDLKCFLNIRTLSFFIQDKNEKMSVLNRIEQVLLAGTEEGEEYRKYLGNRQLWMMEYQDHKNFVLETPEIKTEVDDGLGGDGMKLRFIFSDDKVEVKEFFIFSDEEDIGLDMDRVMEFL